VPNKYIRVGRRRKNDRTQRVRVVNWIDPFSGMQGSSIEKMVMAEFARRGIYFQHSTTSNDLPWPIVAAKMLGYDPHTLKADFLLPQYKIWLEIQGAYFHTLPGAVERDALRFALVEAAGWKALYWWEDDIRTRLVEIMDMVPEFYRVVEKLNVGMKTSQGYNFYEGAAPDTLKGLRAALAGRTKPAQAFKRRVRKKRKKQYGSQ
jgi:hypothetical protein